MSLRSGLCLFVLLILCAGMALAVPFTTTLATYPVGTAPRGVVVFGNNFAVANGGSNNVSVYVGSCTTVSCSYTLRGPYASGKGPTSIDKGHFTDATRWDLVTSDNVDGTVSILVNDGTNRFPTKITVPGVANAPETVVVGDFDGNGGADIAVTNAWAADARVYLLLNSCTGPCPNPTFTKTALPILPNSQLPWGLAKGRFTGAGDRDLVVANYYSRFYGLYGADVLLNNREAVPNTPPWLGFAAPATLPGGFYAPYVTTGRFTKTTGRDDFAITNYGGQVLVFTNADNQGHFTLPAVVNAAGGSPLAITNAGDLNGDNIDDLVVTEFYSKQIVVLYSNGGGSYTAQPPKTVGANPSALVASDLGGGTMLIVVNENDNNVMILK